MHEQAEMLLFFRQASVANQLQAGLDDTFGLPRSRRYQLPSVVLGSGGESVSTMNLNFQGCEIGFLDTGTIKALDAVVGILRASGEPDASAAIEALSKATLQDAALTKEEKRRVLESLEDIGEQATTPSAQRKVGRARALLSDIKSTLQGASAAGKVWEQWGEQLTRLFAG